MVVLNIAIKFREDRWILVGMGIKRERVVDMK
jgi:hypothetical protein